MNSPDLFDDQDDWAQQIGALVKDKFLEVNGEIEPDADLFALGMDSMGTMQLIIHLEDSFRIRIPASAVTQDNLRSPRRIARLIRQIKVGVR